MKYSSFRRWTLYKERGEGRVSGGEEELPRYNTAPVHITIFYIGVYRIDIIRR